MPTGRTGHLRRQQALFERLVVNDEHIADAEVVEPFATLADPTLPDRLDGEGRYRNPRFFWRRFK